MNKSSEEKDGGIWELNEIEEKVIRPNQWGAIGSKTFKAFAVTHKKLPAGCYSITFDNSDRQPVFIGKNVKIDKIMRFKASLADKILNEIDGFWNKEELFHKHGFLHRRGYLLYGNQGCHGKGTKILMYNGTLKKVEDIIVGDLLMGPDSKSRKVLELVRGEDEMFQVQPTKGDSFVVNRQHIFHLTPSGRNDTFKFPLNISLHNYLLMTQPFRERFLLTHSNALEFSEKKLLIDPYILGIWLGDGDKGGPAITNVDKEVIDAWSIFCEEKGLSVHRHKMHYRGSNDERGKKNKILEDLRTLGVYNNKHVPQEYLTSSVQQRLDLIAGLIDTDGSTYYQTGIDFINKNESIADAMVYLCRSVGLAAYKKPSLKGVWINNKKHYKQGLYYRISIFGNTDIIPCRILRKKCKPRKQIKNVLRTGFKISSIGRGNYYGFILNEDHLYLTSDFIIHHNTGKSSIVWQVAYDIVKRDGIVFVCENPKFFSEGLKTFRLVEPERPVVCVFEDIDAIVDRYGETEILALLDGNDQIDRVCNIATTNYPEKLDRRIVNRPRRFDRIHKIFVPDVVVRKAFFKEKLPKKENVNVWVKKTEGLSFAACTEALISVLCLGNKLDDVVKILMDIESGNPSSSDFGKKTGFSAGEEDEGSDGMDESDKDFLERIERNTTPKKWP